MDNSRKAIIHYSTRSFIQDITTTSEVLYIAGIRVGAGEQGTNKNEPKRLNSIVFAVKRSSQDHSREKFDAGHQFLFFTDSLDCGHQNENPIAAIASVVLETTKIWEKCDQTFACQKHLKKKTCGAGKNKLHLVFYFILRQWSVKSHVNRPEKRRGELSSENETA